MIRKFKNCWSWENFLFLVIGLAGIVIVFTYASATSKQGKIIGSGDNRFMASGIALPEKLDFAGEKVPLHYFDVSEALERELLVNSYWHSQTILLIKRSTRYFGEIEPILKKNNIPDDFKYLALAESGFTNVTSPAGAVGFWQFVPKTAKEYGLRVDSVVDERYHLQKSTEAACKFLLKSYQIYKSWTMAAASYNMGCEGLNKQIKRQLTDNYYDILLNDETSRYIYRILALKLILGNPQDYGFNVPKDDYYQPIPYTEVTISQTVKNLTDFSFSEGTNYKLLKLLNPWLRDNSLTIKDGKSYVVRIPKAGFRDHAKTLDSQELDKIMTQSEEIVQ